MLRVFLALILIATSFSFNLKVGSQINLFDSYQLNCNGGKGQIYYSAKNLPNGVKLVHDKLVIVDEAKPGFYTIKLTAQDDYGHKDERLVILIIQDKKTSNENQANSFNTVVKNEEQINTVLDSLNVPDQVDGEFQYPESGYPTGDFPTGINEDLPNLTPRSILQDQANPSDANRNVITSEDVKSHAIFERQLNAAKALANLLSIVKQATANRNAAFIQIQRRTKLLEAATEIQRQAELKIFEAENSLSRVRKGIETTNDAINQIRSEIDALIVKKQSKEAERQSILVGIQNARISLSRVTAELDNFNKNLQNAQTDLDDKKQQIEGLQEEQDLAQKELTSKNFEKSKLQIEINSAQGDVQDDKNTINELKKQLADAEKSLANSEAKLKKLTTEKDKLQALIEGIKNRLEDLKNRLKNARNELENIQNKISELKENIKKANNKKSQIQIEIQHLTDKFNELSKDLQTLPKRIADLQTQLDDFFQKLKILRSQVLVFENRLRSAYLEGNDADEKVEHAKKNLKAAQWRYKKEDKIIGEASYNIELARIQKSKADQAVEDHLRQGIDILPFSSAGLQEIGDGKFFIKSFQQYVRVTYGEIDPLYSGELINLYKFKLGKENIRGEVECEYITDEISISGRITGTYGDSIIVATNEERVAVEFSKCTSGMSNIEDYHFEKGDIVIMKGVKRSQRFIAHELTCIRN